MNIEQLKEEIAKQELEYEGAKAAIYRIDGALRALKFVLEQLESAKPSKEKPKKGA